MADDPQPGTKARIEKLRRGRRGGRGGGERLRIVPGLAVRTLRNSLISLARFLRDRRRAAAGGARACKRRPRGSPTPTRAGWSPGSAWSSCPASATWSCSTCLRQARPEPRSRLSLSELAVNSVVSVSGLAGLALGAWVLREQGFSIERIAKRSVLIFVLSSAASAAAVVVIGVPMWLGLLPGSTRSAAHPAARRVAAGGDRSRRSARRPGRAGRPPGSVTAAAAAKSR